MVYFLKFRKKLYQLNNWLIEVSISWKNMYILRFEVWFKFEWARCTTNNTCMIFFLYSKPPLLKNFIIFVLLMNSLWKKPVGINWWASLMKTHFRLLVQVTRSSVTVIINFTSNCYTRMGYNKCLYACAE